MTTSFLLVVTGASRGFGRATSIAFTRGIINYTGWCKSKHDEKEGDSNSPDSSSTPTTPLISPAEGGDDIVVRVVLISRNQEGMEETARLMQEEASQTQIKQRENDKKNISLDISCHGIDLGDLDSLEEKIEKLFSRIAQEQIKCHHAILINNAGSVGNLGPISPDTKDDNTTGKFPTSLQSWRTYNDFNITSHIWISTQFAKWFTVKKPSNFCTIANISSVTGIRPFPTMSMYCTGKASKEMFHSVLAAELSSSSLSSSSSSTITTNANTKVLNYAPGHIDTDMQVQLRSSSTLHKNVGNFLRQLKESGTLDHPDPVADHLVKLVLSGNFTSGERIDYLDSMKNEEAKVS